MLYCTFAMLFIRPAYGIHDSFVQQAAAMFTILMLISKGMTALPKASFVVIAATLGQYSGGRPATDHRRPSVPRYGTRRDGSVGGM